MKNISYSEGRRLIFRRRGYTSTPMIVLKPFSLNETAQIFRTERVLLRERALTAGTNYGITARFVGWLQLRGYIMEDETIETIEFGSKRLG